MGAIRDALNDGMEPGPVNTSAPEQADKRKVLLVDDHPERLHRVEPLERGQPGEELVEEEVEIQAQEEEEDDSVEEE